eukprot:CAMPEP_0182443122 /NCGR_PEP_ID=MMETSP1172-20130603/1936_1 /TAXON_ID=708627 /ORGANISM="Timspurckia oligopyrenoides, Strain CCMP3278" /LENGTH=270 /DNA_ID=CAMNT_0024638289 /DNA_START=145 /DNA_END=954 /DNA_ORIENTATION=+
MHSVCTAVLVLVAVVGVAVQSISGQSCNCDLISETNCPLVTPVSIDPDGTTRCISDTAPSCDYYKCMDGASSTCDVTAASSLQFNGTEDICTIQTVFIVTQSILLSEFLGAADFSTNGPSSGNPFPVDMNTESGTVLYLQFMTSGSVVASQVIFEAGSSALGVTVELVNANLRFYGGTSAVPLVTVGGITANTMYGVVYSIQQDSGSGGQVRVYVGENQNVLDVPVGSLNPDGVNNAFSDAAVSDSNDYGIGSVRITSQGNLFSGFTGTW